MSNISNRGFTLIELMVAIVVFSVIGVGSWTLLQRVIDAEKDSQIAAKNLSSMQKGFWIMSRDLDNLSPRSIRKEYSQTEAALTTLESEYLLSFTRSGWPNPTGAKRGSLQRVAYRIGAIHQSESKDSGTHLIREFWPTLDRNRETPSYSQILMRDVDHLDISFKDTKGIPRNYWPPSQTAEFHSALPAAITVRIRTKHYGELERIFHIQPQQRIPL